MKEIRGLSSDEVQDRIRRGLVNSDAGLKTKPLSEIVIENLFSAFNLIIGLIILIFLLFYLKTDDFRLILDSIGVFMVAFLNTMIAIFQEIKAKRALDKVALLLKNEVTVIRDGEKLPISPEHLVVDDVVYIERGDQVMADGGVLYSNRLEIDESLLTGESEPVIKRESELLLSGSFCVSGNGCYRAEKIGKENYAADVTRMAKKYKFTTTPLQKKIDFIVKSLFATAIVIVVLEIVFTASSMRLQADFIRKIGSIMIALVPQGLVLTASVTFALGVYRISGIGAIVQKLNAIESFSNVRVACMDKTGTLTKNKLSLHNVFPLRHDLTEDRVKELLSAYASATSDKNATIRVLEGLKPGLAVRMPEELPFSSERKFSAALLETDEKREIYIIGAYEILLERVSDDSRSVCDEIFARNSLEVYRNLLFGRVFGSAGLETLSAGGGFAFEPLAIVSITDEIREDAYQAIRLFEESGMEFKILSGDAPLAVRAICRKIGWEVGTDELVTGSELDGLKDGEFSRAVLEKKIFARLRPEHKLTIIKELKARGIYTAMIGDGVNDLPAIKEAHLGIAMEEGSRITREVADIVLLQNKFSLLPEIFNEGNKIVNTVHSVAKLFLTKNFLVILISLLSIFFLLDFPLTPRRVSLINIFAIGLPALVIALRNDNSQREPNFTLEIFSYVTLSSVMIVLSGYLGVYLLNSSVRAADSASKMTMLSIMIFLSIANFLITAVRGKNGKHMGYLVYALITAVIYFFIATVHDGPILELVKVFYEIEAVDWRCWRIIFAVSAACSLLLYAMQSVRHRIVAGIGEKNSGRI